MNHMDMKHLITIFTVMCLTCLCAWSQPENGGPPPDERTRERIDAARAAFLTERLDLTPQQAERFWPVYHEFNGKRQELRKTFFQVQRKNGGPKQNAEPDPEEQRRLLDLSMDLRQQELDLEKQYSGRFLEVLTADQVLRLHRAERDFQQMVIQHMRNRREQRGGPGPGRGPRGNRP